MINIVIADDHPVMIDGIKQVLSTEQNINIIGEATTGEQLLNILKKKKPEIALLDISMKDMTGLEVARVIQKEYTSIKVLFLSQFDDKWLIGKCIAAGAKGYLIKNISKVDLIKAINLVNEGGLNFIYKYGD